MSSDIVSYSNKVFSRLKKVLNASNMDEVADYIGIKPSTLRSQKSRGSIPYQEIVAKLSAEKLVYVLKGSIDIERDAGVASDQEGKSISRNPGVPPKRNTGVTSTMVNEPFVEFEATPKSVIPFFKSVTPAAGHGITPENETDIIFIGLPRTFFQDELRIPVKECFAMRVTGDSMAPTLKSRDFIIVHEQVRTPLAGRIYLIRMGDSLLCKRLHELPGGLLRMMSDNDRYSDVDFHPEQEQFEILGRVVWYGGEL